MTDTILIHAHCHNPLASGDYTFAADLAKDLTKALIADKKSAIKVFLVSGDYGVARFNAIYGPTIDGHLKIGGFDIGLSTLQNFNAVDNTVLAFIDASRCKYAPSDAIKRVLAPQSKFIFLGNAHYQLIQPSMLSLFKTQQPGLYEFFSIENFMFGCAGLGKERLGLPEMSKCNELPPLTSAQNAMLPEGDWGFMYLYNNGNSSYHLMVQYIKLSGQKQFILIGAFNDYQQKIEEAYRTDQTFTVSCHDLPSINHYKNVPYRVMRQMMAGAASSLVLTTGVGSTLEAFLEYKLPYYQDVEQNYRFLESYLFAVRSIVTQDPSLTSTSKLIINLAELLFANKPLDRDKMHTTQQLLLNPTVSKTLITTNQTITAQARGKLTLHLLTFFHKPSQRNTQLQLKEVCRQLMINGESTCPNPDEALRRAAGKGKLFELKVIIESTSVETINKTNPELQRTALHLAIIYNQLDSVLLLIKFGASLNAQDKDGKTALMYAVINGNDAIIDALLRAKALLNSQDKKGKTALIHAAEKGNSSLLRKLIDAGSRLNIEDANHKKAVDYADERTKLLFESLETESSSCVMS